MKILIDTDKISKTMEFCVRPNDPVYERNDEYMQSYFYSQLSYSEDIIKLHGYMTLFDILRMFFSDNLRYSHVDTMFVGYTMSAIYDDGLFEFVDFEKRNEEWHIIFSDLVDLVPTLVENNKLGSTVSLLEGEEA